MRIAQVAPIAERVPPKKYGGTERVVAALTNHLVRRGHDVSLFASADSITKAKLFSCFPTGLREAKVKDPHGINEWTLLNIGQAYKLQDEFDIIHDHNSPISLPTAQLATTPTVFTVHSALSEKNQALFSSLTKPNLIGISYSQIKKIKELNFIDMVYNGLDLATYPTSKKTEDYLLFVGRISPEKGVHLAIKAALELGLKLLIVAKVDQVDQDYFKEALQPYLGNPLVVWLGEIEEQRRNELYSRALALLHPVTWPEPFGLTMIEAMACGCPVIGLNQGSVVELVIDGQTGFVADSFEEMVESIRQIAKIDRERTRLHALTNFSAEKMTDSYERIYQQVLNSQRKKTQTYPAYLG